MDESDASIDDEGRKAVGGLFCPPPDACVALIHNTGLSVTYN